MKKAFKSLVPAGRCLEDKLMRNVFGLSEDNDRGYISLDFSRINYACIGNSHPAYLSDHNVIIVVASTDIPAGTEVTWRYKSDCSSQAEMTAVLENNYQFSCTCEVHTEGNAHLTERLDQIYELRKQLTKFGADGQVESAVSAGEALIAIYGELGLSTYWYAATYYDLYQSTITRQASFEQAVEYINKTVEMESAYYGCDCECTKKSTEYAANPKSHPHYMIIDHAETVEHAEQCDSLD